jgi:hypothetical protein
MYSRIIRCFILAILFFPAIASAVSCNSPPFSCTFYSTSFDDIGFSCPSGSTVASCPTSNLLGTCTVAGFGNTIAQSWYAVSGLTAAAAAQACTSGNSVTGATGVTVTWSAGNAAAIAPTTPLPPPPTTQSVFAVPTGRMPAAAVSVTPSGTFGNATLAVTLDLSKVLSGGSFAGLGQFAAGYNIYVVALLPKGVLGLPAASLFVLPETRAWAPLGSPIAAYMQGLAQNATDRVVISILSGLDVTGLVGAEIYIGYGTDDAEMLAAGRYRGIYKVQ